MRRKHSGAASRRASQSVIQAAERAGQNTTYSYIYKYISAVRCAALMKYRSLSAQSSCRRRRRCRCECDHLRSFAMLPAQFQRHRHRRRRANCFGKLENQGSRRDPCGVLRCESGAMSSLVVRRTNPKTRDWCIVLH